MGCDFCGNARHECTCKEDAMSIVESLLEKPSQPLFKAFNRLHQRFSNHEWDAMFQTVIAARSRRHGRVNA